MDGQIYGARRLGGLLLAACVPASAPRLVVILGAAGAVALGLAGLLAQGLHIVQAGVLFLGGHLLALWMIWAGIRAFIRSARTDVSNPSDPRARLH